MGVRCRSVMSLSLQGLCPVISSGNGEMSAQNVWGLDGRSSDFGTLYRRVVSGMEISPWLP